MRTPPIHAVLSAVARASFAVLLLGAAGCVGIARDRPKPVAVGDIVEMCKAGIPATNVIEKIRESGTVYRLKAAQIVNLSRQGVPDEVLDHMLETYLHAVRRDQALEDERRWSLDRFGYGYGGAPYGWPYYLWYIERRPPHRRRRRSRAWPDRIQGPGSENRTGSPTLDAPGRPGIASPTFSTSKGQP